MEIKSWLRKWWAYIMYSACPKCEHKLTERTHKRLDGCGKVVGSQPVQWCKFCGYQIFLMPFWFP